MPDWDLLIVADSGYAVLKLLSALTGLKRPVHCITQLRLDAALYEPAAPKKIGKVGSTPTKVRRLLTLQANLEDDSIHWQQVHHGCWYGRTDCTVEVCTSTAV